MERGLWHAVENRLPCSEDVVVEFEEILEGGETDGGFAHTKLPCRPHRCARREAPGVRQAERALGQQVLAAGGRHDGISQELVDGREAGRIEPADGLDDALCRMIRQEHQRHAAVRVTAEVDEHVEVVGDDCCFRLLKVGELQHTVVMHRRFHLRRERIRFVRQAVGERLERCVRKREQRLIEPRRRALAEVRREEADAERDVRRTSLLTK